MNEELVEGISNMSGEELIDYLEHTISYGEATYDGLCTADTITESSTICLMVIERQRSAISGVMKWFEKHGAAQGAEPVAKTSGDSDL
jgi:hypothetical protein